MLTPDYQASVVLCQLLSELFVNWVKTDKTELDLRIFALYTAI